MEANMEDLPPKGEEFERHGMLETSYTRRELNGHWVEYTFRKSDGQERRVAFPRIQIISDEVIAEGDREAQVAASPE
jgi:hypothetical protein